MKKIYTIIITLIKHLPRDKYYWAFATALLIILLLNTIHGTYPDEFDNIAGGRLILSGYLPYTGFFTHHAPFAYYLSALINLISGISFVKFRLVYALLTWIFMLTTTRYLFRVHPDLGKAAGGTWLLIGLSGMYVWSQMLLADSLAGYLIIFPFLIIIWKLWHGQPMSRMQVGLSATLLFLTFLTSFTYLYTVAFGYLGLVAVILRQALPALRLISPKKLPQTILHSQLFRNLVMLGLAPAALIIYLTITGSWSAFVYQAITFNSKYYIYLPDGVVTSNPLRMAVVFAMEFVKNFRMILTHVKDLNIYYPFALTLALGHAGLWILSGTKNRFLVLIVSLGMTTFATARSNPLNTGETDYQANVYQFLGLASACLVVILAGKLLQKAVDSRIKLISGALYLLTCFYLLFYGLSMFEFWYRQGYLKYMGRHPLIYDRPEVAPVLNQILSPDETYYIGPFAFEEHYYMKARLASRHWITIPAMDKSERIQRELIGDLQKNQPRLILIDHEHLIFGARTGTFLEPLLAENYTTLGQLVESGQIELIRDKVGQYDLYTDFYILRSRATTTLGQLRQLELIN